MRAFSRPVQARFRLRLTPSAAWMLMAGAAATQADTFNQKVILVGDKGAALGGAYTGWADDATAAFYNPAGLTLLKQAKLNVSAQIVQFQQQEIRISENAFIPYRSFNFSPTITSFSQKVGRWAFGFSIVTPQNDLFRGEQDLQADYRSTEEGNFCSGAEGDAPCVTRLNLRYSDVASTNLIGPSLAYQWSDRMSVGLTLYGIYSTQLEKTTYGGWDAIYADLAHEDAARWQQVDLIRNVDQTGYGVTAALGLLARLNDQMSAGVRISPGSMVFVERTELQRLEVFVHPIQSLGQPNATLGQLYNVEEKVNHTEWTAPSLSLGAAWSPHPALTVTGQVDYLLGSEYEYTGFSPEENLDARTGFELSLPEKRTYTLEKESVANFSGGLDWRLNPVYSLTIGGYTDFSQGPVDSRPASWNRRVDYFGGALSLGIARQYTESRFGVNAAYGKAAITHFQWEILPGGQPAMSTDEDGGIARLRSGFDAFSAGIFFSSTLKI